MHNESLKALSQRAIPNGWAYWLTVHGSLMILVMGAINASYATSNWKNERYNASTFSNGSPETMLDFDISKEDDWNQSPYTFPPFLDRSLRS